MTAVLLRQVVRKWGYFLSGDEWKRKEDDKLATAHHSAEGVHSVLRSELRRGSVLRVVGDVALAVHHNDEKKTTTLVFSS